MLLVLLALKVQLVQPALKVLQDQEEHKAQLVLQVHLDQEEHKVQLVLKAQ
jgi:hypothetical protein